MKRVLISNLSSQKLYKKIANNYFDRNDESFKSYTNEFKDIRDVKELVRIFQDQAFDFRAFVEMIFASKMSRIDMVNLVGEGLMRINQFDT